MKLSIRNKYKKSLSLLLLKSVLYITFILGFSTGLIQVIVDANESSNVIDVKAYDILSALKEPATSIVVAANQEQGKKLLSGLLTIQGVSSAQLTSSDGSYLNGVTTKLFYSRYRILSDYLFGATRSYNIALQAEVNDKILTGNLSFTIDTAYFGKSFIQRSLFTVISIILKSLLLALILYCIYYVLVTRPLNKLITQLATINPEDKQALKLTVPEKHKNNEIGLWVNTANNLLYKIYNHYQKRQQAEAEITTLSEYDYVTRLPNRSSLEKHIQKKIQDEKVEKIAVLCLGIDSFKELNAEINFNAAEYILLQVSHRLQDFLAEDCYIGKLGEDQFLIISSTIINPIEVAELAHKLLKQFHYPFAIQEESITLKVTIGISLFPEDGHDCEKLFQHAEFAMIQAKSRNHNRYQFYLAAIDNETRKQKKIETELHYALEKQQFVLLFQPLVDLNSKQIIGVEALIRWNHPTMGEVYPDVFIPLLEKSLDIIDVGNWVLEQSCLHLKKWHEIGFKDLRISINLSVVQFQYAKLVNRIKDLLTIHKISSDKIEIEVTESYILEDIATSKNRLNSLKKLGVSLAIDDFGTGYSSLSYLQKFPFDKIKIDKSFIDGLPSNKENSVIVNSIIQLCENFGLIVLAEGVETSEQEQFLIENGCHQGQGYLYGKPITEDEILKLITDYNS